MQNKNNWFSDAIYLDHVTELTKSNQRGEGLNKDWDLGSIAPIAQGAIDGVRAVGDAVTSGAGQHLLPAAVVAGGMGAAKLAGAAKRGASKLAGAAKRGIDKLIDHGTEELRPDEKGATPPGYAPPSKTERGKANRSPNTRPSSEKPITRRPVPKPLAASMSGATKNLQKSPEADKILARREAAAAGLGEGKSPLTRRLEGMARNVGPDQRRNVREVRALDDQDHADLERRASLPIKKSFFSFAVYPEEVGRQDNYSLRKSGPPREPEYVETPKRQPLAKPNFFESTILPHEAGRDDHYLRKGIVPLDRFGFRKAKDPFAVEANWEGGPPEDPDQGALDAHRMANPENTPFVPKPRHVRDAEAARDSAIAAGTYGPDGDTSRSKPAYVPPRRSAPADDGGDSQAKAAEHFDALLDHAKVQNNPDSSPPERNASAAKIGDAVFKIKKLLPQMTKQHIASLITALKAGDMGAIEDIRNDLGMGHPDDAR